MVRAKLRIGCRRWTFHFQELSDLGLRYPHDTGFMDHAHKEFCLLVRDRLVDLDRLRWFLEWVCPPGRAAREAGVRWTVGALVHPWPKNPPPDEIRAYLVESLIEMYGDPRKPVQQSGVWASVEERHMERVLNWLSREDMRFFTGVVDAAQRDPMWVPRRDFWLQLLDEGRIRKTHVAFSTYATGFALKASHAGGQTGDRRTVLDGSAPGTTHLFCSC